MPQDNLGSPQGDGNGKLDDWKPPEEALLMEMSKHKQRKHGHEQSHCMFAENDGLRLKDGLRFLLG